MDVLETPDDVEETPAESPETPDDVTAVTSAVSARDVRMFAGRLERDELNISERTLVALVHAEQGDFRDLDEVREWAAGIAGELAHPKA